MSHKAALNGADLLLKCPYGFSRNDFSKSLINGEQEGKKFSESRVVVCQQITFQIRCFRFTAA